MKLSSKTHYGLMACHILGENFGKTPVSASELENRISVSGKYLETSDYEIVSYTNNVLTGSASVTIKGVGEYGGVKTVKFKIVPKAINWKALSIENLVEFFR